MSKHFQIPIEDAELDQLRTFAEQNLGLEVNKHWNRDMLIAKIQAAWNQPHILVSGTVVPEQVAPGAPPPPVTGAQQPATDGKVRVRIPLQEGPGGSEPVPLSVNGKAMVVHRDTDSDLPYPYFEALKHATKKVYDPIPDGGINDTPRIVPQFPYTTLSSASEIAAAKHYWSEAEVKKRADAAKEAAEAAKAQQAA